MVDKVKNGEATYGYNARTDTYGDMVEMGVIDPAKVVRTALQNAACGSGLLLTTEAIIANKPEKKMHPPVVLAAWAAAWAAAWVAWVAWASKTPTVVLQRASDWSSRGLSCFVGSPVFRNARWRKIVLPPASHQAPGRQWERELRDSTPRCCSQEEALRSPHPSPTDR